MNMRYILMAAIALSMFCCVGVVQASTLFSDDFEGYTDVATSWVSNTDNDPTGYTVIENDEIKVQVHQSPMSGGFVIDTPYGSQFLHMWRDSSGSCGVWKGLTSEQQTEIAANGSMRIEFDAHNVVGLDGWGGNIGVMAFDSAPEVWAGRAFDLTIRSDGSLSMYEGSESTVVENGYNPNSWDKYTIDLDFATDRWSVAVNDTLVASDLVFAAGDLSKVQYILLGATDTGGVAGRGGLDNLTISSPVPEPSAVALLAAGLIGLLTFARRKR